MPQTFVDKHGKRILIGWMGLPDIDYPTDSEGWAHCLTIPRELTIENGKLKQRPLKALETLRTNKETALINLIANCILMKESNMK